MFSKSSNRIKRRTTEVLRSAVDVEVLTHAAHVKLRSCEKRDASQVLKDFSMSPKRATKYKTAFAMRQQNEKAQTKMTPVSALVMFVEAGLSRSQYEIIRSTHKHTYPCYSLLQKAKLDCYPDKDSYRVTDTCAEINLQKLLDHTVTRLLTYLQEVVHTWSEDKRDTLSLICKWGCDGSQQVQYKQTFQNDSDSDAYIFQSSFIPLQLICGTNNKLIWQILTPSSPHYCRPTRIRYVKESTDITNDEINYLQSATISLHDTKVTLADKHFSIKHTLLLTMIDAKCVTLLHTQYPQ
jgi:hypothetical protein